jgi:DNA primase
MPPIPDYARVPPYGAPQRAQLPARYRKPWSLKAIELLLHKPQIALSSDEDLAPLLNEDGENSRTLVSLVELARQNPHIETYTLLGYCYGTPVGNQLTQLMREEKITPVEGIQKEFWQILEGKLGPVRQKAEIDRKIQDQKAKLGAGSGDNPV